MARSATTDPKYRHFKPRNQAVVRIGGKDFYLGEYDSRKSWEKYHRLIAEWRGTGNLPGSEPRPVASFLGVSCLIEKFRRFAAGYYQRDGETTQEYIEYEYATDALAEVYGLADANTFGPKSLKNMQTHMIAKDWSRGVINQRINRIRRMFKWAVAEELVAPSVFHGLQAVPGLRYGRSEARETEPIKPVADEHVNATLPYLTSVVQAMVKLQRITGMRPCELVLVRLSDIDRSGVVWVYEPAHHKNLWRGHLRLIPLGPKAQEILKPFLDRPADAFIFSPAESETERNANRRQNRMTPMTPSQAKRKRKPKPKRTARDRYDSVASTA